MRPKYFPWRCAALCAFAAIAWNAAAQTEDFSFAVISHPYAAPSEQSALPKAIAATDADNLAFVVVNGIKARNETCTDKLYGERKELLETAKNGLVVSLAASDWAYCGSEDGRPAAVSHLSRLRELLFVDEFSMGATRIPVIRQSTDPKYRSFVENARWEFGEIMFATINLPGNNNHFVFDAGRNSEFEDRLVANRDWLHRIFTHARHKKLGGIVLFSDGNPLASARSSGAKRDGYAETRRQLLTLAAKFPGKVLVIHGDAAKPVSTVIHWRGSVGEMNAGSGVLKLTVTTTKPALFEPSKLVRQSTVAE
jgi:hypothetical protein